jgi:soluble lytic murein transglycosylase-like protein
MIAPIAAVLIAFATPAAACYDRAAAAYGIEPELILAIAWMESRWRPDAINVNRNGSEDLCAMQINDQHLPRLAEFGIGRTELLTDLCTCTHVGAWILAMEIQREKSLWPAVSNYHTGPAGDPARKHWYAENIYRIYTHLKANPVQISN